MPVRVRLLAAPILAGLVLGFAPTSAQAAPATLTPPAPSVVVADSAVAAVPLLKAPKKTLKSATPKVTGSAAVGKTLKVTPGKWTAGTKLTYQWFAGGKTIAKATKTSLKLTSKMAGKSITVKVTGKKQGYKAVTKTSKTTAKVTKAQKKPSAAVKIVTFKNCTEMHKAYPHGVGKKGAVDQTSGTKVTNFFVNDKLYAANKKSDRDKDGIACEKA